MKNDIIRRFSKIEIFSTADFYKNPIPIKPKSEYIGGAEFKKQLSSCR